MQRNPWFITLLIILSFCWAVTYIFVKIGDKTIPPFILMTWRAFFAFILLFVVCIFSKKPIAKYIFNAKAQLVFIFSAITIAYMWFALAKSEQVITAAMSSFLLTTLVIFSWIIATFFTKEKPFYYINMLGIIIAVMGVIVMLGFKNVFFGNKSFWYALLYPSGLAVFAISAAATKYSGLRIPPIVSTTYNFFYTILILSLFAFIFEKPLAQSYSINSIVSVLVIGLIGTGVGYLIFFWLVAKAGQVFASMSGYIVPIFGFLMSIGLLNEPFQWHQIVGLVIVFLGTFLTNQEKPKISIEQT
ncbi:MAG: DMT family transporter [Pseudomonadota bacterium]